MLDHRLLVGGGNQQRIDAPGNHGIHNGRLQGGIELLRSVSQELHPQLVSHRLSPIFHRDVEAVILHPVRQGHGE